MKKLQIHFLKVYLENVDDFDIINWQKNLRVKSESLKNGIRRGIGRVKKDGAEEIDNLIDKSWSNILEVIDTKITVSFKNILDILTLEDILKRIIEASPVIEGKEEVAIRKNLIGSSKPTLGLEEVEDNKKEVELDLDESLTSEMPSISIEKNLKEVTPVSPGNENNIYSLEIISGDSECYNLSCVNNFRTVQGYLEVVGDDDMSECTKVNSIVRNKNDIYQSDEEKVVNFSSDFEQMKESGGPNISQEIYLSGSLNDRFNMLLDKDLLVIMSLKDIVQPINAKDSISMKDGLFQINEDVYTSGIEPKDKKLKNLIDSIDEDKIEENSFDSIESSNVGLSLFESKQEDEETDKNEDTGFQQFLEKGFNYDKYRSYFKKNKMGIVESLMEISQKFDATFLGLFVLVKEEWHLSYSFGLNQEAIENFIFKETDDFSKNILNQKKVLLFKKGLSGIEEIDSKFYYIDRSDINGGLFVPVVFKGADAYFIFGMKVIKSIQEYIKILKRI